MSYNLEYTYVWYSLQCNYNKDHKVHSWNFKPGEPCPYCVKENPKEGLGTSLSPSSPTGFRTRPMSVRRRKRKERGED